ncbi:MAG TPA: anti-CBASS Acb1 family protein [Candidatus Limnocylindria bacterium]|nr:anti-CBASS Acb1 family protein [Candidatus Limnocylindria bacterium]
MPDAPAIATPDNVTALRADDWTQLVGGLGSIRDKHVGIEFKRRRRLTRRQLEALYEQNPLAARVVDLIVDEALREGWEFETVEHADPIALHERIQKEIQLDRGLEQAGKWSRLYGGALLTVPTDAKPQWPLGMQTYSTVYPVAVESDRNAIPLRTDDVLGSPTYKRTTVYQVTTLAGKTVDMHASHAVPFEPIRLPVESQLENMQGSLGWGPSVLGRLFDALSRYGASYSYANAMLYTASILYVQFSGWREDYLKPGGPAALERKIATMRAGLDSLGLLGLDADDKIASVSHSFAGTFEILDRMANMLAASADMPKEILFNESPAGLNAGELSGPQEIWFAKVRAFQRLVLEPAIEHVLKIVFAAWGIGGAFKIRWKPLWTRSESADAELAAKNAATDKAYWEIGAVSDEEIRTNRFVKGNAGPIVVEPEKPATALELDPNAPEGEPAAEQATPADEAMNGAQISSLIEIMTSMNTGMLTYPQAVGALGVAFPTLRGREASVLGPMPAQPIVPAAPPPVPGANAAGIAPPPSSNAPMPGDAKPVREAAAMYGVKTRTITRLIETGKLGYWGFGTHKIVSLAELATAAKAHESEVAAAEAEGPADDPGTPEDEGADERAALDDALALCKRFAIPVARVDAVA